MLVTKKKKVKRKLLNSNVGMYIFWYFFSYNGNETFLSEMVAPPIHFHAIYIYFCFLLFNLIPIHSICTEITFPKPWEVRSWISNEQQLLIDFEWHWRGEPAISDFYTHIFTALFICCFPVSPKMIYVLGLYFDRSFLISAIFVHFARTKWKSID